MSWRDDCRVTGKITLGSRGPWRIEEFEVPEHSIENLRLAFHGGRSTKPGTYTRLVHERRGIVMSDTDAEMYDLSALFWHDLRGRILVNGLGLGCVVRGLLGIREVEHIDVVEIDPDVIALVGSQFQDPRLAIHEGDAFTYKWPPNTRWDFVWHDVWDELNTDNLSNAETAFPGTYEALNRRYGRRTNAQAAWGQHLLQRERARSYW